MNLATVSAGGRLPAAFFLAALLTVPPAQATLQDNGDGTVTDTDTSLMWAKDANLFATLYNGLADNAAKDQFIKDMLALTPSYKDPLAGPVTLSSDEWATKGDGNGIPDHATKGLMTIYGAIAFVNWLNSTNWSGHNDWRLPEAKPIKGSSFQLGQMGDSAWDGTYDVSHNFKNTPSELTHLYYDVFGMQAQFTTTGVLRDPGTYGVSQTNPPIDLNPFTHFEQAEYFTGTFSSVNDNKQPQATVWSTNFASGIQHLSDRGVLDLSPDPWLYMPIPNGVVLVVRKATGGGSASAQLGTIAAFAEQEVGTTSAAQTVSLSNTGTAAYGIKSIAATAEFAATHDCGNSLAAGKNCSIQVSFSPSLAGSRGGTLTVTPASGSPLTLSLTGTGKGAAPNPVLGTPQNFGDQAIFAASAPQVITLSNSGSAAFAIASIATSGDFSVVSNTCGETLAANGATCSIGVVFTPSATGSRTGTLTVTQTGSGATVTASLAGNGISAGHLAAATGRLDFGAVASGKTAKSTLLLINDGTQDVQVGSISSPDAPFALAANRCTGRLLKPGKTCKVGLKFTSSGGEEPVTGTVTVSAANLADLAVTLSGRTGAPGEVADVAAVTPDIGFGGRIVLSGKEFTSRPGKVAVDGKRARILAWSDTTIVVAAPKLTEGSHTVDITRKGTPGSGQASVNMHKPELTQLDIASGTPGATMPVTGRYFGSAKSVALFQPSTGGKPLVAKPKSRIGEFELQVLVPKRLAGGEYEVAIKNPVGSSDAVTFTVN
ncbi:MAG: choice-of-anchor D domain-containing protein [Methylococcaceae bacterium]|nr:choice-of-anchor D domain-containing protein [Methylococcaceae bacterium]